MGTLWGRFGDALGMLLESFGELLGCGGTFLTKFNALGTRHPAGFLNSAAGDVSNLVNAPCASRRALRCSGKS